MRSAPLAPAPDLPPDLDDVTDEASATAANLSLEEAARLLAGEDAWHLPGVPSLGLPPIQVADCGHGVTLVAPPYGCATCFPTSVGMAATWNVELLEEVGAALGRESRAKGLGMLLAPMVNLHRLPCGGRNYETFSEDPMLTGRMAAALIRGIQSEGVAACIKSFACNNQQRDQKTASSEVDARALRELYLKVFGVAFEEGDPWAVMTSYNPINGEHPSDSRHWLETVLREEMGYRGFVVSDWNAVQGDGALGSGLDLEMPGPGRVLTPERILAALRDGAMSEADLRARVDRLLRLHRRVRRAAVRPGVSAPEIDTPRHRELARRVAEESIVLLQNRDRALPLERSTLRRVAVVGPNAAAARLGGGGSASVSPFYSVSPLAGIRAAAGPGVEIVHAEGCPLGDGPAAVPASAFGDGLRAEYFAVEGVAPDAPPACVRIDEQIDFSWGWAAPADRVPRHLYAVRWSGRIHFPDTKGAPIRLALETREGVARVWLDGRLVLDAWSDHDPGLFEQRYAVRQATADLVPPASGAASIVCEYRKTGTRAAIRLGWAPPGAADGIEEAARLAASADAVVVCAGLSNLHEGGNCDRAAHELPGRQAELIRRVAAANPRVIVVLNNGTPVEMASWRDHVAAVVEAFYPGQEGGHALARVLFGDVNPSGRLGATHPRSWAQVAAMRHYPGTRETARYDEGLFVGYRDADGHGWVPEFPFGFGLSYTRFTMGAPRLSRRTLAEGEVLTVEVEVANVGDREGAEIVQAYLEPEESAVPRPPRELFAFAKVRLAPGERRAVALRLRHKDLLTYDPVSARWTVESPRFRVATGPHSRDLRRSEPITVRG